MLAPRAAFDALVGKALLARNVALMRVKTDPMAVLYRESLLAITSVLGISGRYRSFVRVLVRTRGRG
jgi:hypothetical protein